MSSNEDVKTFFPQIKGNLSSVTWAHAVNNKSYLHKVLNDASVMMIEADVVFGKIDGTGQCLPIMAHPPANISDLSLAEFVDAIKVHNEGANISRGEGKGIKLDFKQIEAYESAINIIKSSYDKGKYPLWLNADILPGPVNPTMTPVDAKIFLNDTEEFVDSIYSLGWTTNVIDSNQSYTDENVKAMQNLTNHLSSNITFAVRALLVANSMQQMKNLLTRQNSTLTIWSGPNDKVDMENLRKVIIEIGDNMTFLDLPKELRNELY